MTEAPETRFAKVGRDRVAYQTLGEGPFDLLYLPTSGDCIDLMWDYPPYDRLLRRLASFSRLITFDRRGTGASDAAPSDGSATWESWSDDAGAVLDAVESETAALLSQTDGAPTALLFAATRPERTRALVLFNSTARFLKSDDYPFGLDSADADAATEFIVDAWGTSAMASFNDQLADDPTFVRWLTKSQRLSRRGADAAAYFAWVERTDVRQMLSSVRAPTMVLHRKDATWVTLDQGQYLAEHIYDARFVPLDGAQTLIHEEPNDDAMEYIEEFLTGAKMATQTDRALAAILFTDIVGSTEQAAALGDRRWRQLLESHDSVTRSIIEKHRGRLVKLMGDGALAIFDGPGRAIRCAQALHHALDPLGIKIRAGLHTGEVELLGEDIGGIGVHIAARIMNATPPGDLLVSQAVPMLVAGSGIEFEDRGLHELKGVPGTWQLFAVQP